MAVKVTLEFENVDAAIVGLSKLVGTSQRVAATAVGQTPSAGSVATASRPSKRRGRSDKGQPRGSYKVDATTNAAPVVAQREPLQAADIPPVAAPQTAAPQEASPVTPTELPAAAAVLTDKDAQAAVSKLFEAKGLQVALQVLSRFGAKAVRELKPTQYVEFVQKVNDVLNGGEV